EPAVLLDGMQAVCPSREDLMGVRLVADVPDQAVLGGIEHVVQGNGQLDRAEPGCEVAPTGAHRVDEELPQLSTQLGQLAQGQPAEVGRGLDRAEKRILIWRSSHLNQSTRRSSQRPGWREGVPHSNKNNAVSPLNIRSRGSRRNAQ